MVLLAGVVAACAAGVMLRSTAQAPAPAGRTVGAYFDQPPAWPGPAWKVGKNRTADWPEIDASAGPSQCGWQAFTFLTLEWPLGTVLGSSRLYIRDPFGRIVGAHLSGTWAHNPTLPGDAVDTRFHYGALKLYLASDADQYVYIVAPNDSERWPRSDPPPTCD